MSKLCDSIEPIKEPWILETRFVEPGRKIDVLNATGEDSRILAMEASARSARAAVALGKAAASLKCLITHFEQRSSADARRSKARRKSPRKKPESPIQRRKAHSSV